MSPMDRPNGGGRPGLPNRPMTVAEIAEEADSYEWKPQVPLKFWIGALETLYREGKNYEHDGNYAKAYMLLLRYASLYLKHVSTHPDAKLSDNRRLLKPMSKRLPRVFDELEVIKPLVAEAHDEWVKITQSSRAGRSAYSDSTLSSYDSFAARDAALSWNPKAQAKLIDASSNQELAVELATRELKRRGARRAGQEPAYATTQEQYQPRPRSGGNAWSASQPVVPPIDDLQQQMEAIRWRLDHSQQSVKEEEDHVTPGTYNYPSISKSTPVTYDRDASRSTPTRSSDPKPPRPPKHSTTPHSESSEARRETRARSNRVDVPPKVPPRPTRSEEPEPDFSDSPLTNSRNHYTVEPSPLAPELPPKTLASPSKSRESKVTFKPAGYLENGEPIRPVFLPTDLRKDFLRLAAANTARNIETCGLLCGSVVNNALFVSTLLVPEQEGSSDMCEMKNEPAVFDFMDKEDLIQLGWIHTHPSQTCFMSSRDLHTHAGYQTMFPESIAIVCAPSYEPSWDIFRLTNPPGLPHVIKCSKPGIFHEHDIPTNQLYLSAQHPPGHVYVTSQFAYKVHDLRSP